MDSISVCTFFFFGDQFKFDRKTASIWLKTDQNLGQDRLMLFPASKKASPLQIPGYAPAFKFRLNGFDFATANFLAVQGATGVERF